MKLLLCHAHYQVRGGEDESFAAEAAMLERHGHQVVRVVRDNTTIASRSQLAVAGQTIWNHAEYREIRRVIRSHRPDLMHCTNLFPLISPSAYYAARAEGVPVVQSLRNYRLSCLNSFLFRDGRVCEDCLGRMVAWHGVWRGCYRDSRAGSAVVASMLSLHRAVGTWRRMVDAYFTVSEFSRRKLIEAGVPAHACFVKPNFVHPDPGIGDGRDGSAIFVGRLSPEKGVAELIEAWKLIGPTLRLRIVGDGPLRDAVRRAAAECPSIEWLGRREPGEVLDLIGRATLLVMPSQWYETFGRTIVEAFAKGTPVVATRLGAMAELVEHGRNGLLVQPGDIAGIVAAVRVIAEQTLASARMRREARATYERSFTESRNYAMLMDIYERARRTARGRPVRGRSVRGLKESA